jgi:hypothetical protein
MDELKFIKERRLYEHQFGDVRKACEKAGVSPTVFQSALRKTKINELTDKEMLALLAFSDILNKRKADREALKNSIQQSS